MAGTINSVVSWLANRLILFCLAIVFTLFACDQSGDAEEIAAIYPDCLSAIDTTASENGYGCGNIFLYKTIKEGLLTVRINPDSLILGAKCNTYEFDKNAQVNLEIYPSNKTYRDSAREINYCTDVIISNAQKRLVLKALDGSLTASVKFYPNSEKQITERITAQLKDLKFLNPVTKDTIAIPSAYFWNVRVGWIAG